MARATDMALIGLMTTRNDAAIFETWCAEQLSLNVAVVCSDGSATDSTRLIAERFSNRLIYLHDRAYSVPQKTGIGLRRVVHLEIVRRFGTGHWIMCSHADEFCYHDPRKIAAIAERQGYDLVSWFSPHFYPHPSELEDCESRQSLSDPERHRIYHWAHVDSDRFDGVFDSPWNIGDEFRPGSRFVPT